MSAIRRATPFLVASTAGIVSGVYIFRPLILQETEKRRSTGTPNHQNVIGANDLPKGQDSTKNRETH
ncbi:hypothetical protein JR316_0000418 [Psilocybe cubensis]|uniref:Uncharacterized protein n=2 Tax=Psilocybe cubensis TaxID=181762 RepID=A0ACB8HEU8_PSICU|nr:hypothetical protein JR316_0000418 [Psilocybe cubensis]KAH9486354.1 hypothetical protein JR316_0000418 [Psilocybe cubensis]